MDLFIQLMKTPGLGEEIKKQIIINKNKNIEINKKNLINELQEIIDSSLEDIYQEEVIDFTDEDLNDKICESIEEFNENAIWCEKEYSSNPCEKFHHIILHNITGKFW
tara:strand:+ start:138 stop:461 length:324 start_codon:yes stop_codon:yes gene_type:complete